MFGAQGGGGAAGAGDAQQSNRTIGSQHHTLDERLETLWSATLPAWLEDWSSPVAQAMADGAWTAAWRWVAAYAPPVAFALGLISRLIFRDLDVVYGESLAFLMLLVAGSILSGTVGVALLAGYIVQDLIVWDRVGAYLGVADFAANPAGVIGGKLVTYLLLAVPAIVLPLVARQLTGAVKLHSLDDPQARLAGQIALGTLVYGALAYLWAESTAVLLRPLFTLVGAELPGRMVADLQAQGVWVALVAALAASVRAILAQLVAPRSPRAGVVATLQRWHWTGEKKGVLERIPEPVRTAIAATVVAVVLAGTYATWFDALVAALVIAVIAAWRANLIQRIPVPVKWALTVRKVSPLLRLLAAILAGYALTSVAVVPFWGGGGTARLLMVGSLLTLLVFSALFPALPVVGAKSEPGVARATVLPVLLLLFLPVPFTTGASIDSLWLVNGPAYIAPTGPAVARLQGPVSMVQFSEESWHHLDGFMAAAVALGAGMMAALMGGLLTGLPGTSPAEETPPVPVAAAQAPTPPLQALPAAPAPNGHAMAPVPPPAPPPVPFSQPPDIAAPIVESALAAGVAAPAVASTVKSGEASEETERGKGEESEEIEKPCPEAQAYHFGLPANNDRKDCPGVRPSMGRWYTGIDFSSKDEHDNVSSLDFEAFVTGEVTYVGGEFNMVEVKLGNGNRIQFLHASDLYVRPSEKVGPITKLGRTGGVGPEGPNQYETHLHVQAIDKHGNLIDPDCALASMNDRKLRTGRSRSPFKERIAHEKVSEGEEAKADVESEPLATIPVAVPQEMEVSSHAGAEKESTAPVQVEAAVIAASPQPLAPPLPSSPPVARIPTTPLKPVYCVMCGQVNPGNAKFCKSCGTPIVHVQQPASRA